MAAKIRVGVVGYGGSAKNFHIPFISNIPAYELIAVLQRAEAPTGEVAKGVHCTVDIPGIRHYRTSEEFFGDADIDFVVVATRGDTHTHFAEKALEAGKHGMFFQGSYDDDNANLTDLAFSLFSHCRQAFLQLIRGGGPRDPAGGEAGQDRHMLPEQEMGMWAQLILIRNLAWNVY